ncbi:MAG: DUF362 domain-containing protein [Candidatus Lokiarchaeota archaeon]|nr:DUF362 domain-containing protein [Candidatus Lokiarchaeota archaeon]
MKMSDVYFTNSRAILDWEKISKGEATYFNNSVSLLFKFERLIEKSGILNDLKPMDSVAVKMHWGDWGTTRTIRSLYVKKLVDKIKEKGAFPFITESAGLGLTAIRSYGIGRLEIARNNGYTSETCGAPLIPADGLKGLEDFVVDVDGLKLKKVHLASILKNVDKVISLAHFKGHPGLGVGGALKNIAVGFGAKTSKFEFHMDSEFPVFDKNKCTNCNKCIDLCPVNAISKEIVINKDKCLKCLGCVEICPEKALTVQWSNAEDRSKKMVDIFKAAQDYVGKENIRYINLLMDVTPICDCIPSSDNPIVPDIGILISRDPLAIDKASIDLINEAPLNQECACTSLDNKFAKMYEGTFNADPKYQLDAAKKLNVGNMEYKLIEI